MEQERVYLDICCLNRLTDDQSQDRIRDEAEAVERVLRNVAEQAFEWLASEPLIDEIERNPQPQRRMENLALLSLCAETIAVDAGIAERARELQAHGYGPFDALHLACAEAGRADVLLTTDDKFIKRAPRGEGFPTVPVRNPLSWMQEQLQ